MARSKDRRPRQTSFVFRRRRHERLSTGPPQYIRHCTWLACQTPTLGREDVRDLGYWVPPEAGLHSVTVLKGHDSIEFLMNLTDPSPKGAVDPAGMKTVHAER